MDATAGEARGRTVTNPLAREGVWLGVIWVVLASVLGEFATHVRDYIDFDAGRYEHLAISIARTHSLVPRVDGVNIHSYSQLYPLLIAPFFVHGFIESDYRNIGIFGAYLMSSACIPAFLLTRRVTPVRWLAFAVAVLTICMPWIVTSFFMMTEIAAYPAFAWALYAMVVALASPSKKHDVLVLVALVAAYAARGELIGLALVLPLALVAYELGQARDRGVRDRLVAGGRSLVRGHPILTGVYLIGGAVSLVLYLTAQLQSVIGIYGVYSNSAHLAYSRLPRAIVEHLATFSLGVGVIPLVVALAWIGANLVRPPQDRAAHAFACVGSIVAIELFVQSTNFDLVVNAYIHDRFLMYFVPVVLVGTALAVTEARKPRWSLVLPLLLVVAGFVFGAIPPVTWKQFPWLDLDTPISSVYRVLAFHLGSLTAARAALVAFAVIGTGIFYLAARQFRSRPVAIGAFVFAGVAMLFATTIVFQRAFDPLDRNLRQVTQSAHGSLDWIDGSVGPGASVTAIPYPISTDWFVSEQRWVDFEFFNKSITRVVRIDSPGEDDPFDYIGIWFPKLQLHANLKTGAIAESPTPWVVESIKETRLRIAGLAKQYAENGLLLYAGKHWRLAWRTFGLYDDGWTRPNTPMTMRVYASAGQKKPVLRAVDFVLRAPAGTRRPVTFTTGGKSSHLVLTNDDVQQIVNVCVPPNGYGELKMSVKGSSTIPGDLASYNASQIPRRGGIFIASLSADDTAGPCTSANT
jgi:hypothetical protein